MILLKFFGVIILFCVIFVLMLVLSAVFGFWGLLRQIMGGSKRQHFGGQNPYSQNPFGGQNAYGGSNASGSHNAYNGNADQQYSQQTQQGSSSSATITRGPKPRNSVIDKNEGEYVEFEEIS